MKIFDYANHALELGYEPVICAPEPYEEGLPLFENPRFSKISPENGISFTGLEDFTVTPNELAFFSWPPHYRLLESRLDPRVHHEQAIHIVQNVRHANPRFTNGYALRLLTRPMARITTNEVVLGAVKPYLNRSSFTEVIPLGCETEFFAKERSGGLSSPIRVGYTTWKSGVGDRVASALEGRGFEFRAIREHVPWLRLRELYHWADVFLATPLEEEGFYMPGFEAMCAGTIVLSPDAGGNRAYCRFGENCFKVDLDDAESYVEALKSLSYWSPENVEALRLRGYEMVEEYTLRQEKERFAGFLDRLTERLEKQTAGTCGR